MTTETATLQHPGYVTDSCLKRYPLTPAQTQVNDRDQRRVSKVTSVVKSARTQLLSATESEVKAAISGRFKARAAVSQLCGKIIRDSTH